ncbi:MAG: Asp-tRNA(Asn)/Glu-tRNA(Gln) amidotransferase subunit GatB [Patescibacteria group bacterium]|nr:Asp-tRNA(Asn)/Glu-tRNA(Gln) amidotransferase subunit GatB [Patescibacteria group bacterium]
MGYKPTIGLEIHIELATNSKMFCSCQNNSKEELPNTNICPVCTAQPGSLPVINREAIRKVIKTAIALNCQIAKNTYFERKNYFYPDLPKGYQISQYQAPLARRGWLEISSTDGNRVPGKSQIPNPKSQMPIPSSILDSDFIENLSIGNRGFSSEGGTGQSRDKVGTNPKSKIQNKKIRIERIHLEEDTAKLVHPEGKDYSLIDFNRVGIPLMELVTEPDITSAVEAREFIKELQLILRYLQVSSADMEKGEMRAEVNISLTRLNVDQEADKCGNINVNQRSNQRSNQGKSTSLGTKVEIKNLNSLRAVEKAIEYEIKRQSEILKKEKKVIQETRGWDAQKEITFSQREKEEPHDYRYFPEPDLPPLSLSLLKAGEKEGRWIAAIDLQEIKAEIPELPQQRRERFKKEYQLPQKEIELYVSQKDLGEYFEKVVSELSSWVKTKKFKKEISEKEFKKLTKSASNYISTDLQGLLKEKKEFVEEKFPITPENFAEFLSMIYLGEISSKIAKTLLKEMFEKGGDPSQIIEERGLRLMSDERELESIVKKVITKEQKAVRDYKKGKEGALQFLVGKVMAKTKGLANPEKVQKILKEYFLACR